MIKTLINIFKKPKPQDPPIPEEIPKEFFKEVTIRHTVDDEENIYLELTHKPTAQTDRYPGEMFTMMTKNQRDWKVYNLWKRVNNG